jgi:type IV secretory pathway VirJ component
MKSTVAFCLLAVMTIGAAPMPVGTVTLRGRPQQVQYFGSPAGRPVIVSSGDGGWVHVAPHVAEWLASHHYFVVGFDAKAYLTSRTNDRQSLSVDEVPADYAALIDALPHGAGAPILVGISEGGGLSIRAAADPVVKERIAGVITLGLGDINELAWRWRDSIIYVTKGIPREPSFRAGDFLPRVSPAPLAMIRATSDEFVSPFESDRLAALARGPKRVWSVQASNHRFSDNPRGLDDALADSLEWLLSQHGDTR